jgi:hypothetical protein
MVGGSSGPGKFRPMPAWGHSSGILDLGSADVWGDIPALLVAEAQQCVNRYGWAFDERREDILREVFTEDAVWEASVMDETPVGPFEGRDAVIGWLSRFWGVQKDQRRHAFTNFIVDKHTDDQMTAYCYLQLLGSTRASSRFEVAGFSRAQLVRVGPRWAISRYTAGFDAPFWPMPIEEMTPELRELFGIGEGAGG